jgi:hypothetical protein
VIPGILAPMYLASSLKKRHLKITSKVKKLNFFFIKITIDKFD